MAAEITSRGAMQDAVPDLHSGYSRGRLCASPQPWSVVSLNLRMSVATDPALSLDILVEVACTMVATCNFGDAVWFIQGILPVV